MRREYPTWMRYALYVMAALAAFTVLATLWSTL